MGREVTGSAYRPVLCTHSVGGSGSRPNTNHHVVQFQFEQKPKFVQISMSSL